MNKLILTISLCLISLPSYAYIGPGMSGGVIAAIVGFLLQFFLGFGNFILSNQTSFKK